MQEPPTIKPAQAVGVFKRRRQPEVVITKPVPRQRQPAPAPSNEPEILRPATLSRKQSDASVVQAPQSRAASVPPAQQPRRSNRLDLRDHIGPTPTHGTRPPSRANSAPATAVTPTLEEPRGSSTLDLRGNLDLEAIVEQSEPDLQDNPPPMTSPVAQELGERSLDSASPSLSPRAPHMSVDNVDMMDGHNGTWFHRYPYLVIDLLLILIMVLSQS
jgi:hypothetical protein